MWLLYILPLLLLLLLLLLTATELSLDGSSLYTSTDKRLTEIRLNIWSYVISQNNQLSPKRVNKQLSEENTFTFYTPNPKHE